MRWPWQARVGASSEGLARRSPARRAAILAIKIAIGLVVIWALGRHVERTWIELHKTGRTLSLDPSWLALSVVLYVVGLCPLAWFFWRVMQVSPTPVRFLPALRAYLVSHLGKYVPGKAMVVVIRAGMVVPFGARAATAAFATLYETLVMMAAGGLLAAAAFAWCPLRPLVVPLGSGREVALPLALMSLALGLALFVVTLPGVFARISLLISVPFPGVGPDALPRTSITLQALGLFASVVGWILLGLSQVAVIRALGIAPLDAQGLAIVVGTVALATLIGFVVAIFPGGLGIRELVIMVTLAPLIGDDLGVVAALVLRLAWVAGELLAAAPLWLLGGLRARAEPAGEADALRASHD